MSCLCNSLALAFNSSDLLSSLSLEEQSRRFVRCRRAPHKGTDVTAHESNPQRGSLCRLTDRFPRVSLVNKLPLSGKSKLKVMFLLNDVSRLRLLQAECSLSFVKVASVCQLINFSVLYHRLSSSFASGSKFTCRRPLLAYVCEV